MKLLCKLVFRSNIGPFDPSMVLNERLDLKTNLQSDFRLKKVPHKVLKRFFYWGGHIDPPCTWRVKSINAMTHFQIYCVKRGSLDNFQLLCYKELLAENGKC